MKRIFLYSILFVLFVPKYASAVDESILNVQWDESYKSLTFEVSGETYAYPDVLFKNQFPPHGQKPEIKITDEWPFVLMKARWTASKEGWPEQYKDEVLDLVLMFVCNAQVYENIYPEIILSSKYTAPLQFIKEAKRPDFDMVDALRGKHVEYEITANAGVGAKNYIIKTAIRIGTNDEGTAVYYHDKPYYISDHLKQREFLFAAYDNGDYINFEVIMLSECKPRSFMKKETMRRIRESSQYFVERMYESLDDAPTIDEIEDFFKTVIKNDSSFKSLKE